MRAAEHLRGLASDEGDRLGMDESGQVNEPLDNEDSTLRSRLPSSAEISTGPPRELEESFPDDLDVNMAARRVVCVAVRKILEKLKSLCSLRRLHVAPMEGAGETASSTQEQGRALSAENEAGALGTFDDTWHYGSEDAAPFWHDEGGPDSLALAEDKIVPRKRQASTSTSSMIFLKFQVHGWSENAWDPAFVYILMDSAKATDKRFEVEVPITAIMNMSSVSAGTFVSVVIVAPADN